MTYLQQIETLPAEIIQDFRKTGRSLAIPNELQQFIKEVDSVIQIKETEKFDNISRIARELMKLHPSLTFRNARERVYDAYNLFHVNDSVSNDAWDNIYADKMEDLAKICIAQGKEQIAYKAFEKAHEYRTRAENRIKPEDLKAPVFIISTKIKAEDLGFEKANLKEIAKNINNGEYLKMINSFDIDKDERKRILDDAQIIDAEIIDEYE